jgi:sigma-B regulation protein RsbU (phosphoserine phosphatase)
MPRVKHPSELERLFEENHRLKVAVDELSILNEIAIAISSTLELDRVIDLIIQKCVKHLKVEQGAVWLISDQDQVSQKTIHREYGSRSDGLPFRLGDQVTGWMQKNRQPFLSNDFSKDERIAKSKDEKVVYRSVLAVPLHQKGRMIGVLTVFNKRSAEGFTEDDKRLLTIIGAQSSQVIEAVRLYREEQELQQIQYEMDKLQHEMNLAREIQTNLLPKNLPSLPEYDLAGLSIPAKKVGGDYYDFISVPGERLVFCLGDVSGKGVPAALLMANLQATLRSQTLGSSCARECLEHSNTLLYNSTDSEKFATLFYAILDTLAHRVCFANAGHNYPFLVSHKGDVQRLKTIGIPLGFLRRFEFTEHSVSLLPGDLLVVFSDGITEAMNPLAEEFGEGNLQDVIAANRFNPAGMIIETIIDSVNKFAGGSEQSDDMTLICIKRKM